MRTIRVLALSAALLAVAADAACYTFYEGLCPGAADCMCTLSEGCGVSGNISAARTADGGCSGQCRLVAHGECPGSDSCLADLGSCGGPAPPPPPPPASGCYTFYEGLCPGAADCMCTLSEGCGVTGNISAARTADGGCSGQCRQVAHGECPGSDSCLKDIGSCGGPGPVPPTPPGPNRGAIISCAQDWCNRQVPYCQCNGPAECCGSCPYCGTFRCDCSGFVSYCLGLSYGYTTDTLPTVCHQISKAELQLGDIMLCVSDHVVFFGGWTDSSQTDYVVYQEPGCHTSGPHYAFKSVTVYPFNWNPTCFQPYRSNALRGDTTCKNNMASKQDVIEAYFTQASFPLKHAREALEAQEGIDARRKAMLQ